MGKAIIRIKKEIALQHHPLMIDFPELKHPSNKSEIPKVKEIWIVMKLMINC